MIRKWNEFSLSAKLFLEFILRIGLVSILNTREDALIIPTDLFVVWVADDQKCVIWPWQDVFPRVVPGYSVDLQADDKSLNVG